MSQFRKKPVVINAVQWDGTYTGMLSVMKHFPEMTRADARFRSANNTVDYWRIRTLEGAMQVSPGDWIIKGIAGEYYPCKDEIFAATYEPAFAPPAPPAPLPGKENLALLQQAYDALDSMGGFGFTQKASKAMHELHAAITSAKEQTK